MLGGADPGTVTRGMAARRPDRSKRMKVNPVGAGLDEGRLERITEHLQHRYVDAGRIPGCHVAVAPPGHLGDFLSLVSRDPGPSIPLREDTLTPTYSRTNPVT